MKYKNKDGIELSYTQRNNTQTDLVKEVISECTDFKNKNPKHNKKPVIEAKEEIKIENDENIYKLLITIIILILIIIIGVFYFKKAS